MRLQNKLIATLIAEGVEDHATPIQPQLYTSQHQIRSSPLTIQPCERALATQ